MSHFLPALLLLASFPVWSQSRLPTLAVPAELRSFLGLADDEAERIGTLAAGYYVESAPKLARIEQLTQEIQKLREQERFDAQAVAERHAEAEKLRREIFEAQKASRNRAQALLSPGQRTRLKLLEDAIAMRGRIQEAACVNLLPGTARPALTSAPQSGAAIDPSMIRSGFECPPVQPSVRFIPQ